MNFADDRNDNGANTSDDRNNPATSRNNEENELEAEQESAEAMDADVPHANAPQPSGADETTEGQPT